MTVGLAGARPATVAEPTMSPYVEGRHVYDYANLLSPHYEATAEALAARIEAAGGGRVVLYTADLMDIPDDKTLARDWHVDGLLLTAWEVMGTPTLGATLTAKLNEGQARFIG